MFVNGFGLPYNTGVFFYLLLSLAESYTVSITPINIRKVVLNTVILAFAVVLIGYSSYVLIMIRSTVNPPMDMNNPETVFDLLPYLTREQYGQRPLLKGQYYNAPIIGNERNQCPITTERMGNMK